MRRWLSALDYKSRSRAAALHLGASSAVALIAAALVFLIWYPAPFDTLAGGSGLFVILVSVDVVIGPLITWAVFNRSKPKAELARDLAIVVALQLAALGYGLHTMHAARPVVFALEGSRLRVVSAVDVLVNELPLAPEGLRALSSWGPKLVRTVDPVSGDDKFDAIQKALAGYDLGTRPKYWRPWDDAARAEARAGAKPLADLLKRRPEARVELDAAARNTGQPIDALVYLPIVSRFADAVAIVDARTGDILGYAMVNGF